MSEKSEALRLADALEMGSLWRDQEAAAAELRFLHAENEELRRERDEARRTVREAHEAGTRLTAQRDALLEALRPFVTIGSGFDMEDVRKARAAIKAVEEGE